MDSNTLFRAVAPALHACLPLLHPNSPCAPIRNEATLLAAAALALPGLAVTESVRAFAAEAAMLCWAAITISISDSKDSTSSNSEAAADAMSGMHQSRHASEGEGDSSRHPALPGNTIQKIRAAGWQNNNRCDDADPVRSLWLKNAALLYFSPRGAHGPHPRAESDKAQGSLLLSHVSTAMGSTSYDVRAACLKALVKRTLQGASSRTHWSFVNVLLLLTGQSCVAHVYSM